MSDSKPPDTTPPPKVRIVKTPPEEVNLLVSLLQHAIIDAEFARQFVPNFSRLDFKKGAGDIFEAVRLSIEKTDKVERTFIAERVGWQPLLDFLALPRTINDAERDAVLRDLVRDRTRQSAIMALHDRNVDRAKDLLAKIDAPLVAPVETVPAIPVGEVTEEYIEEFMAMVEQNSKRELLGFKTSIYPLDKATSGLIGGETWAVAAPTSGGKTQLAAQIVNEVCLQNGRAMYLSLEMPSRRILARLVAANVGQNPKKIFEGKSLLPLDLLRNKIRFFAMQRTVIRDDLTELSAIEKFVKDYVASGEPLHLVVVDFIQNVSIKGVNAQVERMLTASVRLQALARATGTCFLVLSQMSNEAVAAKGKGVMNHRYGNELGHAADIALEMVPNDANGTVDLLLRKNRSGEKDAILLRWAAGYSRFEPTI